MNCDNCGEKMAYIGKDMVCCENCRQKQYIDKKDYLKSLLKDVKLAPYIKENELWKVKKTKIALIKKQIKEIFYQYNRR